MAIIQPILGSLRGSIGDNTFSHNRGGDYVRRRVAPTNKNSTRQQTMRAYLSTLASLWSFTLTPTQRANWNTWASNQAKTGPLGNSINLTGLNAYVWCNTHILDAGDTRIDSPPITVAPGALVTLTATVTAPATSSFAFTATPLAATKRIVAFMSLPQSGAAQPNLKQCRIIGYSALAQASPWNAVLPITVLALQNIIFFAGIYESTTGLLSQFLRTSDISA